MIEKVDETIEVLCEWVKKEILEDNCVFFGEVAEMTKALADLVSARAELSE